MHCEDFRTCLHLCLQKGLLHLLQLGKGHIMTHMCSVCVQPGIPATSLATPCLSLGLCFALSRRTKWQREDSPCFPPKVFKRFSKGWMHFHPLSLARILRVVFVQRTMFPGPGMTCLDMSALAESKMGSILSHLL